MSLKLTAYLFYTILACAFKVEKRLIFFNVSSILELFTSFVCLSMAYSSFFFSILLVPVAASFLSISACSRKFKKRRKDEAFLGFEFFLLLIAALFASTVTPALE